MTRRKSTAITAPATRGDWSGGIATDKNTNKPKNKVIVKNQNTGCQLDTFLLNINEKVQCKNQSYLKWSHFLSNT